MSTMSDYYCPDEPMPEERDPEERYEYCPLGDAMEALRMVTVWAVAGVNDRNITSETRREDCRVTAQAALDRIAAWSKKEGDRMGGHCDVDAEFLDPFADDERVMERRYGADA